MTGTKIVLGSFKRARERTKEGKQREQGEPFLMVERFGGGWCKAEERRRSVLINRVERKITSSYQTC